MSLVACALALASVLALDAPAAIDPASLALDELIRRLPRIEKERGPPPEWRVDPLTQELGRRLRDGVVLSSEQWRRVLVDTGTLCVPRRWVAGEPFAITSGMPAWLDLHTVLVLEPADPALRRGRVGSFDLGWCGVSWTPVEEELERRQLGVLAPGRHEILFTLRLLRATPPEQSWPGLHPWFRAYLDREPGSEHGVPPRAGGVPRLPDLLSSADLVFDVEIVPTLDEAIPPVSTPALDDAVRRALTLEWDAARAAWDLVVAPLPELEHVALSLDVRLVDARGVAERWRLCPSCPGARRIWLTWSLPAELEVLTRSLASGATHAPAWTLRVTGTAEDVLQPCAERRWAGTLELSIGELIERGKRR